MVLVSSTPKLLCALIEKNYNWSKCIVILRQYTFNHEQKWNSLTPLIAALWLDSHLQQNVKFWILKLYHIRVYQKWISVLCTWFLNALPQAYIYYIKIKLWYNLWRSEYFLQASWSKQFDASIPDVSSEVFVRPQISISSSEGAVLSNGKTIKRQI